MHTGFFIIISGPTGVGKTELSLALDSCYKIEIINGDMGQLYSPLSIGTAKPSIEEQGKVPHHLFGCLDEPVYFSVSSYRRLVLETMQGVWSRGAIPVVVGGSFFYLKSLFFQTYEHEPITKLDKSDKYATFSNESLWHMLYELDPRRAQMLHKNDRYRIERAIDIADNGGILPSNCTPEFNPLGKGLMLFLKRDREDLYKRINDRVITMFEQGWVEEAAALKDEWKRFLLVKKILGYPEIIQAMEKESVQKVKTDKELIEKIQQKTRNYAKRQQTFWRSLNEQIYQGYGMKVGWEIDMTHSHLTESIKSIKSLIKASRGGTIL